VPWQPRRSARGPPVYETLGGPKKLTWLTGEHTEFYDKEPQVTAASEAVAAHFAATAHRPPHASHASLARVDAAVTSWT
jgi:hypothetical protein